MLRRIIPAKEGAPLLPERSEGSQNGQGGGSGSGDLPLLFERLTSSLVAFWYEDLPPLSGPLRLLYYLTLRLFLELQSDGSGHSALRPSSCQGFVEKFAYYKDLGFPLKTEVGFFGWFLSFVDPIEFFNCALLGRVVRWGFVLSAIGFGGRFIRAVTAAAYWTMFGIKLSTFGPPVGHELYLTGVALIAFCFAEGNLFDQLSVDSQLLRVWSKFRDSRRGAPSPVATRPAWKGGPSLGGAARKLVLYQAVCVMFFAGLHKFASHGPRWLDGGTIYYSMDAQSDEARSPLLHSIVYRHAWLFLPPMATASVVGELGSVATFISPWWRPFGIASFVGFHIGIMLLMHPNFLLNMITYTVCLDWVDVVRRVVSSVSTFMPATITLSIFSKENDNKQQQRYSFGLRLGAVAYTLIAATMFTTSLLRVDYFPFSSWALYNWYPHRGTGGYYDQPFTPTDAREMAAYCMRHPPLNPACDNLGGTNHHDNHVSRMSDYVDTVIVTGREDHDEKDRKKKRKKDKCDHDELSVYKNWKPYMCVPRSDQGKSETLTSQRLQELLRVPINEKRGKRKPRELDELDNKKVLKGIAWRVIDAVAASIDEGPQCFGTTASNVGGTNGTDAVAFSSSAWEADPSPSSTASNLARQLRTHLTGSKYVREGETVLAVGIFFEFVDERDEDGKGASGGDKVRSCKIGASVVGDGDSIPNGRRMEERKIRERGRDWTDVRRGIFITMILAVLTMKCLSPTKAAEIARRKDA